MAKRQTKAQLRGEFERLQRFAASWVLLQDWRAEVKKLGFQYSDGKVPTPSQWVRAAKNASVKCDRCHNGIYYWGAIVNGKPTHSGECFQCGGKGRQDMADFRRNRTYWNHVKVI